MLSQCQAAPRRPVNLEKYCNRIISSSANTESIILTSCLTSRNLLKSSFLRLSTWRWWSLLQRSEDRNTMARILPFPLCDDPRRSDCRRKSSSVLLMSKAHHSICLHSSIYLAHEISRIANCTWSNLSKYCPKHTPVSSHTREVGAMTSKTETNRQQKPIDLASKLGFRFLRSYLGWWKPGFYWHYLIR